MCESGVVVEEYVACWHGSFTCKSLFDGVLGETSGGEMGFDEGFGSVECPAAFVLGFGAGSFVFDVGNCSVGVVVEFGVSC